MLHSSPYRHGNWSCVVGIVGSWLFCTASFGAQLTIPNTFVPGAPAKADQVNGNFTAAANAVNANDQLLTNFLKSHSVGGVVVTVGAVTIGPLVDASADIVSALSRAGFFVDLATGTVREDGPIAFTSDVRLGVVPTIPVEGALNPERILFTGPNCTGTPFVSLAPFAARQGVVVGNPANAQLGYYARGEVSLMSAQSQLELVRPEDFAFGASVAEVGTARCRTGADVFAEITVFGIAVKENDPRITGVPNNISGPINLGFVSLASTAGVTAPLQIPNTFVPGTPARANNINANFAALASAVNAQDQRLAGLLTVAGNFVVKVGTTVLGTALIDETVGYDDEGLAISVINPRGFGVKLATGATDSGPFFGGVLPSSLTEGALFPVPILFTELNCSGSPFVSFSPEVAKQGVVFANPSNLRMGYYARGTPSALVARSVLVYVHPNSLIADDLVPLGATEGNAFCVNPTSSNDFAFQPSEVLGVPVQINDPKITGVSNDLAGPITFSVTH